MNNRTRFAGLVMLTYIGLAVATRTATGPWNTIGALMLYCAALELALTLYNVPRKKEGPSHWKSSYE